MFNVLSRLQRLIVMNKYCICGEAKKYKKGREADSYIPPLKVLDYPIKRNTVKPTPYDAGVMTCVSV